LASGRTIRVLTVVDTFTRECLGLEADSCLPSPRVTRALDQIIFERGRPESIRMDNELNASHFLIKERTRRIDRAGTRFVDAFDPSKVSVSRGLPRLEEPRST